MYASIYGFPQKLVQTKFETGEEDDFLWLAEDNYLMACGQIVDLPFSEHRNVVSYELLLLICTYEVFGGTLVGGTWLPKCQP